MARAKRTDRTDARRRYRAQFAEDNGTADDVEELADTTETTANGPARRRQGAGARAATASSGASTPAPAARPARPGLIASARAAYHPAHIREDLALLPGLLFHWSLLVTIGVAVVATAVFIASTNDLAASIDFSAANPFEGKAASAASNLSYQVIAMFVAPPPVAGALIIGFFAKRASWLLGLIFGLAAALCYVVLLAMPAGRVLIGLNPPAVYIAPAFLLSPLGAMLFASGAVWYRRFLQSMGPSPSQRGKPAAKPVQGRGNVRRNRLSS